MVDWAHGPGGPAAAAYGGGQNYQCKIRDCVAGSPLAASRREVRSVSTADGTCPGPGRAASSLMSVKWATFSLLRAEISSTVETPSRRCSLKNAFVHNNSVA